MFCCFQFSYTKEKFDNSKNQLWLDMMTQLMEVSPKKMPFIKPLKGLPMYFYEIVNHKLFEMFIFMVIICNLIIMTMEFEGSTITYFLVLERLNIIFSLVFIIEAIFKLIAYGKEYFNHSWNIFDFIVVCTALLDIILTIIQSESLSFFAVFKVFQILRVFRLIRVLR